MSSGWKNLLIFLGGVSVGAASTYFVTNYLNAKKAREEEPFYVDKLDKEHMNKILEQHKEINKPDVSVYANLIQEKGYIDYSAFSEKETEEQKGISDKKEEPKEIRVVTEEYFNELSDEDYRFIGYSYFNDYILADENNEEIDINEVNTSVGSEWRSYFDDPECNAVYVVNERLHVAYEILRNLQNYRDVAKARGE